MSTPMLPLHLDHTCDKRIGGPLFIFDADDSNASRDVTERECGACQWLVGYEAGWKAAKADTESYFKVSEYEN